MTAETNSADQFAADDLGESKIDFQHRAVREGFAAEAAEFRVAQRKRFRAQGKTKAEAGTLAWAATFLRFPRISQIAALWFVMGQFPPRDCTPPEPGQPDLPALWYALHAFKSGSCYVDNFRRTKDANDLIQGCFIMANAADEAPTPSARAVCLLLKEDPREFFGLCERAFNREIASRRQRSGEEHVDVIEEVNGKLELLTAMHSWWEARYAARANRTA